MIMNSSWAIGIPCRIVDCLGSLPATESSRERFYGLLVRCAGVGGSSGGGVEVERLVDGG